LTRATLAVDGIQHLFIKAEVAPVHVRDAE